MNGTLAQSLFEIIRLSLDNLSTFLGPLCVEVEKAHDDRKTQVHWHQLREPESPVLPSTVSDSTHARP